MEKCCKECGVCKDLNDFYGHPLTNDKRMGRCKSCVLIGRKTEHELKLARVRDRKRYNESGKRRSWIRKNSGKFRIKFPWKARASQLVALYFKRVGSISKPKKSFVSGETGIIHLHHFDYSRPNEVIPCTPLEHRAFHKGSLCVKKEYILVLPFDGTNDRIK